MQEDMPEDMPGRMPEDMPEDMPDRMPEDMSDRMPVDLPVTKRINVMVGITRSKVIYFVICFSVFPLHPQVMRLLQSGGPEVNQCPIDRRKFNGRKDCQKADSADSFFNYYYHHIVSQKMLSQGFQISI